MKGRHAWRPIKGAPVPEHPVMIRHTTLCILSRFKTALILSAHTVGLGSCAGTRGRFGVGSSLTSKTSSSRTTCISLVDSMVAFFSASSPQKRSSQSKHSITCLQADIFQTKHKVRRNKHLTWAGWVSEQSLQDNPSQARQCFLVTNMNTLLHELEEQPPTCKAEAAVLRLPSRLAAARADAHETSC